MQFKHYLPAAAMLLSSALCVNEAQAQLPQLQVIGNQIQDDCGSKVILRGVSTEAIDLAATSSGGITGLIDRLTNTNDDASSSPGWYTRIIRFPVYPSKWDQDPDKYLNTYLIPAVDYATELGLYVIIDWHYVDDVDNGNNTASTSAFWEICAPEFKDYTNVWYELYNEPEMGVSWSGGLRALYQQWFDIVRTHAPDNIVLVGSETWSQNPQHGCDQPIIGENVAYVIHMYANHHPWLVPTVEQAAACVPLVMTEWGFRDGLNWDPDGGDMEQVSTFGQPMIDMMHKNDIHWTAWCASEDWEPAMFNPGWELRVGEGEMGGFIKDVLYTYRQDDQPCLDLDGPFSIGISVSGNGSIAISPIKEWYELGETVTISATADDGSSFVDFSGLRDLQADGNTFTFEVEGNRSFIANFLTPFDLPGKVEAEAYHAMSGIQSETTQDVGGGENIGWTESDDYLLYTVDAGAGGVFDFSFRVAANGTGASSFDLYIDDENKGAVTIPNTGDWQNWADVSLDGITLNPGIHEVKILSTSSGWNLNHWTATEKSLTVSERNNSGLDVEFYPNPVTHILTISGISNEVHGKVLDVKGAVVLYFNDKVVDFSPLDRGLYTLQLQTQDGQIHYRIMKK